MDTTKHEFTWRCDCLGPHFLGLTYWPDTPQAGLEIEGYLEVEGAFSDTWRNRIAMAWNALFKGHAHSRVGLVLDAPKAREVAAALTDFANLAAAPSRARFPDPPPPQVDESVITTMERGLSKSQVRRHAEEQRSD